MIDREEALEQIQKALLKADEYEIAYENREHFRDLASTAHETITICASTIERLASEKSSYRRYANQAVSRQGMSPIWLVGVLSGVLQGLREDINNGYLESVGEAIRADVFADVLGGSDALVRDGYITAAAVTAGAALEAHLRALAEKTGVKTTRGGKPKRAGLLNDDLSKADAFSKAEHKQVIAWQDIRNDAAHGDGEKLAREQVVLMIQGIRDFITRHPA